MALQNVNDGYLEIILGPMFSRKTSALHEIYEHCMLCDTPVMVLNHISDNRYKDGKLCTHNGREIPCMQVSTLDNVTTYDNFDKCKVILINEGQFFMNIYNNVRNWVDNYKKNVYICGLDGDFKRNTFGELLLLIPICDKVTKLKAICLMCKNGKPAIFSHRKTYDNKQVVIGNSNYVSLCRSCYLKHN